MDKERLFVAAWNENPSVVLDANYLELNSEIRTKAFGTVDLEHDDFACVANEVQWGLAGGLPKGYDLLALDEHPLLSVFYPDDPDVVRGKLQENTSYLGEGRWPRPAGASSQRFVEALLLRYERLVMSAELNDIRDDDEEDDYDDES